MQKLNNGSILFTFIKKIVIKTPSFRSYDKATSQGNTVLSRRWSFYYMTESLFFLQQLFNKDK